MKRLRLPRPYYEAMLAQLADAYPLEACGLMAGRDGLVTQLYPVSNILRSPYAYEMDPHEQLRAILEMEAAGWELLAIYHSHPRGPQVPSATDVERAYYPEAAWLIVSLAEQSQPVVRAFTIIDGQVDEIILAIV